MYKFENVTQGMSSYLSLKLEAKDKPDSLYVGMMGNNHIKGLLPMSKQWENQGFVLMYQITGLSPLSVSIQNLVDERRFVNFLKGICDASMECGEYLLNPGKLLLDEKYVYIKPGTGEVEFAYIPLEDFENEVTVQMFIKQVIHKLIHSLAPDSRLKPILYEYTFEENFDIKRFRASLDTIKSDAEKANADAINSAPDTRASMAAPAAAAPIQQAAQAVQAVLQNVSAQVPVSAPDLSSPFGDKVTEAPTEKKKGGLFGKREKEPKEKKEKEKKKDKKKKGAAEAADFAVPGIDNPFAAKSVYEAPKAAAPAPAPAAEAFAPKIPDNTPKNYDTSGGHTVILQQESDVISQVISGGTGSSSGEDATQIDGMDIGLSGAYLELIESAVPGAMGRIDIDMGKSSLLIGRISSDENKPDIAFPREFTRIGRQHARMENRGGELYLTDLGSVNHTLLNGQTMSPNQAYKLTDGAEISFTISHPVRYRVHM